MILPPVKNHGPTGCELWKFDSAVLTLISFGFQIFFYCFTCTFLFSYLFWNAFRRNSVVTTILIRILPVRVPCTRTLSGEVHNDIVFEKFCCRQWKIKNLTRFVLNCYYVDVLFYCEFCVNILYSLQCHVDTVNIVISTDRKSREVLSNCKIKYQILFIWPATLAINKTPQKQVSPRE